MLSQPHRSSVSLEASQQSKVSGPQTEEEKKLMKKKKKRRSDVGQEVVKSEDDCSFNEQKGKKSEKFKKKRRKDHSTSEGDENIMEENNQDEENHCISTGDEGCIKGMKSKKSKKLKKKRRKEHFASNQDMNTLEKTNQNEEAYCISSGDEDCTKGMKKWLTDYYQSRPGIKVLQRRVDEFIIVHEEKLEQERKEREAQAAEGGWTVVKHHKGRKKTTDFESGVTVGSVAQAAAENQMTKKKSKEVGLDFYRFQKREAQRNEILALQSKFEEDRKRIQQLRAARKFRPY